MVMFLYFEMTLKTNVKCSTYTKISDCGEYFYLLLKPKKKKVKRKKDSEKQRNSQCTEFMLHAR